MEGLLNYGCDREISNHLGRDCIRKDAILDLHKSLEQLVWDFTFLFNKREGIIILLSNVWLIATNCSKITN